MQKIVIMLNVATLVAVLVVAVLVVDAKDVLTSAIVEAESHAKLACERR